MKSEQAPWMRRAGMSPDADLYYMKYSGGRREWGIVGTFDPVAIKFTALTVPRKLDYHDGFYASKSFLDNGPAPKVGGASAQQILWGWVLEEGTQAEAEGWAGTNSFPRAILPDMELGIATTPPSAALIALRGASTFSSPSVALGNTSADWVPLKGAEGAAVDIDVTFTINGLSREQQRRLACIQSRSMPLPGSGVAPGAADAMHKSRRLAIRRLCTNPAMAADASSSLAPESDSESVGVSYLSTPDRKCETRASIIMVPSTGPLNNTDMPGGDYRNYALPASATAETNI